MLPRRFANTHESIKIRRHKIPAKFGIRAFIFIIVFLCTCDTLPTSANNFGTFRWLMRYCHPWSHQQFLPLDRVLLLVQCQSLAIFFQLENISLYQSFNILKGSPFSFVQYVLAMESLLSRMRTTLIHLLIHVHCLPGRGGGGGGGNE